MNKQRDTIQSLDAMEKRGMSRLLAIERERAALGAKREELLLQLAEGDQTAKAKLEKCDASIADLNVERESIESLLRSLPARRDWAQGVEIENRVPKIEQLIKELPGYVEGVKASMPPVISAVQRFRSYIHTVEETEGLTRLPLFMKMISAGQSVVESSNLRPSVASEPKSVPIDLLLIAFFFDDEINVKVIDHAKAEIGKRIERMKDHARRLKKETTSVLDWAYCPGCYEQSISGSDNQGRCYCRSCGKTFAAEKVPGAIVAREDQKQTQEM